MPVKKMRVVAFLSLLYCFPRDSLTGALLISLPTIVLSGPTNITYMSQASDNAESFNLYLGSPSGYSNFSIMHANVSANFTPTTLQITIPEDTVGQVVTSLTHIGLDSVPRAEWVLAGGDLSGTMGLIGLSLPFVVNAALAPDPFSHEWSSTSESSTSASSATSSYATSANNNPQPTMGTANSRASSSVTVAIGVTFVVTAMILLLLLLVVGYLLRKRRGRRANLQICSVIDPELGVTWESKRASEDIVFNPACHSMVLTQRIQPFRLVRAPAPNLSHKAAQMRQDHLNEQLRLVQQQLDALEGVLGSGAFSSVAGADADILDLKTARRRNDALQMRRRTLQSQLHSPWALGLIEEPLPVYRT
ncbi:hypothetical protein B0H19DRAFT_1377540 [Mycena capillaripes]|nr:hypothetical protein B0H19DRAFT_1377540 [Mycena capillaripes]